MTDYLISDGTTRALVPERREATAGAPPARTLLDVFAATVSRCPARTALEAPDASLTYAELADASLALGERLRSQGIGPGDRVGIRIPSGTAELYLAILGVLQSGAAYVPVDADDPAARAETIWERASVSAVLERGLEIVSREAPASAGRTLGAEDDAWVIFTSGSTGTPKGVAITHRSAAAFVDAEARLFSVSPDDRVLAGLSVAFDASCEEIWLAWRSGAALVPAPRDLVRSGPDLGPWLARNRITVVSTVPTIAACWEETDLADVRLLILGGEACPEGLGWRLAAGREVWNTYGPTEATVVATATPVRAGKPVTIGWALNGWEVAIVDDHGEPVALGEPGELVISGVGLGRYLDPALDAERYAPLPALGWERAYRTGDIVREQIDGIAFVGRRDDQVKLGGRRIELGEVEAQLRAAPGVNAAAAAVHKTPAGNPVLVGYVVGRVDPPAVRAHLADHLPHGIVPLIVEVEALPMSAAGKLDRKALPWPPPQRGGVSADGLSGTAAWLAELWAEQLGPLPIALESDFFELGGSSLAAAKLVSRLRGRYPAAAVADVYKHRPLRALAERLEQFDERREAAGYEMPRPGRRLGLMQLAGVGVLLAISSIPWLLGTFAYGNLAPLGTPHVPWVWLIVAWALLASVPAHTAIQVIATRLLLRNLKPGRYPRYSWLVARLWFIERLSELMKIDRLAGTPWADRYARLVGADVGEGARLATVPPLGSLLHVGAGATIEGGVNMHGWWIDGQEVVIGEIRIGAGARIGSRSLLNPGTVIGEGAEIEPGSVVYGEVPAGEHWGGSPAVRLGEASSNWPDEAPLAGSHPRFWKLMFALAFQSLIYLLAIVPGALLLWTLHAPAPSLHMHPGLVAAEAALIAVTTIPTLAVIVALTLRLVWRLLTPGWHRDYGAVGWALWFGDMLKTNAEGLLFPLLASVYTRSWLRLMGLTIGRRTEVSTSSGLNPLVRLGELSQVTDDVGFCGTRARGGWLCLERIDVGSGAFIGPGAVLRGGTQLGDRSLIGALTVAPHEAPGETCWFGVPALELPRVPDTADPARTTAPPRRLVAARAIMDLVRLFGPSTVAFVIGSFDVIVIAWLSRELGIVAAIALAPWVMLAAGVFSMLIVIALKWTVIGRYRRGEHPLWSFFVWRDELINTAQEQLGFDGLLGYATGTPLMNLYLRAMGGRVGRGVWVDTTSITEFEMVDLGDGVAVNRHGCLMTHVFQDRLLRIGPTKLGPGATLGPKAAVLPDTMVGAGTCLLGHAVLLRGEELPGGTRWHGAPVTAV
jgi:non-ribosomal peptide synthetase-like protein